MSGHARHLGILLPLLAVSCSGPQNMLDAAGEHARRVGELWWLMLAVTTAVYVAVCVAIAAAVVLGMRTRRMERVLPPLPQQERRMGIVIGSVVAATAVILFAFLVATFSTGHALNTLARSPADITIKITGWQWWWEIEYQDPVASNSFTTANEMHLPLGRTVQLILVSGDVIHSFWVPNLAGKKDLIPGHQNTMWLKAERPGRFDGQCAEFCGLQHANMRLRVVVETDEQFQQWLSHQRTAAAQPQNEQQRRGHQIVVSGPCAMCHAVRGTDASGFNAPDLTHLASRERIAAGVLPNTRGHLAGWIANPQEIKPGNKMPPIVLTPEDQDALLAYLESLK